MLQRAQAGRAFFSGAHAAHTARNWRYGMFLSRCPRAVCVYRGASNAGHCRGAHLRRVARGSGCCGVPDDYRGRRFHQVLLFNLARKLFFCRPERVPVRERDGLMAAGDGSRRQQGAGLDPACVRVGMTTRLTAVQTLSPADDATQHCVPMQPPGFLARSADFMRALRRLSSSTGRSGCWWGSSTLLLSLSPNTRV